VTTLAATAVLGLLLAAAPVFGPDLYSAMGSRSQPRLVAPYASAFAPAGATAHKPELPRSKVDTTEPSLKGRTIHVAAGESLQGAIDDAQPGDRITLEAGATYEGPFRLPRKAGNEWIVIASSALGRLRAGERVDPDDARHMPALIASSRSVIVADEGAHHYRFAGVEVAPASGEFLYNLIELGGDDSSLADLPHHIIFDRSYIHGDPRKGGRRGIALNAREAAVINSYVSDFKEVGADSQAIAGWNGPGPFKIENNYLEGAGENVMFGGADPSVEGLVPADIEVLRNHMTKPLRWKLDDPGYEGTPWAVKNLFELKNARRVLIDGNLFEHNWPHAQNGFSVLFTVRNQEGGAPWSVVEDITFRNNVVRHVAAGFNILGRDDNHDSRQTSRILIHNNRFTDVGGKWGGNGRLFQLLDGTVGVSITHNTAEQSGGVVFGGDHAPHQNFVFRNNVTLDNSAGFVGSGSGVGRATIDRYFPGSVITGNVFVGGKPADYPPGNFFTRGAREAHGAGALWTN
jgi:hypothetical protein